MFDVFNTSLSLSVLKCCAIQMLCGDCKNRAPKITSSLWKGWLQGRSGHIDGEGRNPCPCLEVNSGPADAVNADLSKIIVDQWLYFAFDRRAGIITCRAAASNLEC